MKITKTQLKQVIKEEMNKVLLENLISEMNLAQLQAEKEAAAASLKKVKQAGTVITQIRDAMMPLDDGMKLSIEMCGNGSFIIFIRLLSSLKILHNLRCNHLYHSEY